MTWKGPQRETGPAILSIRLHRSEWKTTMTATTETKIIIIPKPFN